LEGIRDGLHWVSSPYQLARVHVRDEAQCHVRRPLAARFPHLEGGRGEAVPRFVAPGIDRHGQKLRYGHAADDRATERPAVLALDVEAAHLPRLYAGRPVALLNGVQVDDQWQPVRLDADSDRPSPGRASARIFKHFYVHPSSVGPVSHLRHCGRAVHEAWTTRLGPKLTVL